MDNTLVRLTTQDVSSGIPITDSLIISEKTGVEHKAVRQLIKKYSSKLLILGNLDILNAGVRGTKTYHTFYNLNEEQSFFLLTLSQNTEKVVEFKFNLTRAFFMMKNELLARTETRVIGISIRKSLTDSIRDNVSNEGNFKKFAYGNYSKMVYKKVLGMTVKKFKEIKHLKISDNVRDYLSLEILKKVQQIESDIATIIEFSKTKDDKELYQEIKEYLNNKVIT